MVKATMSVSLEIETIQKEYHLEKEDVLLALQSALGKTIGSDILVTTDEGDSALKVFRLHRDGTLSPVGYKAFKKGKKELVRALEDRAHVKESKRRVSLFKKGDIVKGVIFDRTKNGCFVQIKGEKAFFPFCNGYDKEKVHGLYEIGNTLAFKILGLKDNKVIVSRRSLAIMKESIYALVGRVLPLKLYNDETLIIYCSSPFLEETHMALIKATLPVKIVFKKQVSQ
ncbi:MAG: S1 RNA-binding domain-containing protein [Sulfurospirillum sp.]|jgi:hypothetical protein|nr:S1 RNA-binding domain-containing protein [Sulfurospirillum sp.]